LEQVRLTGLILTGVRGSALPAASEAECSSLELRYSSLS